MRIVFLSQWYPPEQAPIGYMVHELAQAATARGHEATVITGFPNHPSGTLFRGYRKQWRLEERLDGVDLLRVYLVTAPNPGRLTRILTFLSFTATSAWALLRQPRTDLVFAVFQPLSVGAALPLIRWLKGFKLILNVQDLHPDVPIELGLIRSPLVVWTLRWIERLGYRTADGLAVICDHFREHCVARGARHESVAVIPNWIDLDKIIPGDRDNHVRAAFGLSSEDVVVLYAGTVGMVSGAEIVLEAAFLLEKVLPAVRFVFVGEGPALAGLREHVQRNEAANVLFMPFQPRDALSDVQAIADVSLVTLRRGRGRTSVPSKVLGYMAAGRPVIASVDADSETAQLVRRSGCGVVVEPECSRALADAVAGMIADPCGASRMGSNGRRYLEEGYGKASVTDQYIDFFEKIVESR